MKNLFFVAFFALLAVSCEQQSPQELLDVVQVEHPQYVVDAVNKHLKDAKVKKEFLSSLSYDKGLYITDMDLSVLEAISFSSEETLLFLMDLLEAKLTIASEYHKNIGCPIGPKSHSTCTPFYSNSCLCKCRESGSPTHPFSPCVGGGACTEWIWIC
ncbi:MAG: hypothetical protein AAF738_03740 [Bacteroidota bacterium]